MNSRQLARPTSERVIDLDKIDFLEQGVEVGDGVAKVPRGDAVESPGLSERGACLGAEEPDAHNPIRAFPKRSGTGGARFGDEQTHNRRSVEVRNHLHCSPTRSETTPLVLIGVLVGRFG